MSALTDDQPIKILIVEDHHLIAQGLQLSLRAHGHDAVLGTVGTPDTVLAEARALLPDLVLLDLQLGDMGDGKELIPPLRQLGAIVIMLTGVTDRVQLAACLEAGATGLASKTESFDSVLEKVNRALAGQPVNPVAERETLLAELRKHRHSEAQRLEVFNRLSRREREVLGFILAGKSAETIAEESFVSLTTVRSQIRAILQKLGVNSQLAAAAMARAAGWTPDAPGNHQF